MHRRAPPLHRAVLLIGLLPGVMALTACPKPTCSEARARTSNAWQAVVTKSTECTQDVLRPKLESDMGQARGNQGNLREFRESARFATRLFSPDNKEASWSSTGQVARTEVWGEQFEGECPGLLGVVRKAKEARSDADQVCR